MLNYIFNFIIGSCLGSHALVVVQRNKSKNFISTLSKCDSCQMPLTLLDQVPIISFLFKHGKCSFCKAKIPPIVFFTELFCGFCFIKTDFTSLSNIPQILFLYFFILCAIFDFYDQEFETSLLIVPAALALFSPHAFYHYFSTFDWLIAASFLIVLIIMNVQNKLGLGDTIFFILVCLFMGLNYSLNMMLVAALTSLIYFILLRNCSRQAFLPFMLLGYIYQLI